MTYTGQAAIRDRNFRVTGYVDEQRTMPVDGPDGREASGVSLQGLPSPLGDQRRGQRHRLRIWLGEDQITRPSAMSGEIHDSESGSEPLS